MNRFLTLIALLLAFISLSGQENNNPDILKVSEEIELNTDREIYFNGEQVHFNATYLINGAKTKPTLSNVLYVELIDCANNKPVVQKKYQIIDFNVSSKITVPFNINSGNYMLRAFTQYQRNLPGFKYSYKLVTLLNPGYDPLSSNKQINVDSIYIAPEGGYLIDNLKNKVVIHIPEKFISDSTRYYIKDQDNTILSELTPNTTGIMQTEKVFKSALKYHFEMVTKDNDIVSTPFPAIKQKGIQTSLAQAPYNVNYKIQHRGLDQNSTLKLSVLSSKFMELYTQTINLTDAEMDVSISKNQLTSGLNYFVLTDDQGIKNINSCYIANNCKTIDITTSKETYEPQEVIDIRTTISEISHLPVTSVSVTKEGTQLTDHEYNKGLYAIHPILLVNFLKRCNNIEAELAEQLLILTDNHIKKEQFGQFLINGSDSLDYIPEIRSLTITGVLRNKVTKEPVTDQKVYLSVLFNNPQLHIYTTRDNGEFIFSLNNVYAKNDIYLCTENTTNTEDEYELLIKSSFPSDIPDFSTIPLFINKDNMDIINQVYNNAQIQQKFHSYTEGNDINKNNISGIFNLNDNKLTIDPDKYVDFENMEELFYEIVPNVIVKKDNDDYFFKVLDENDYMLIGTPLILVDHIPVFSTNKIMKLNPAQIEKIEVIYKPYILGSHKINGVVMLTTNTENFAEIKLPQSSTFLEYEALELQDYAPEFESIILKTDNEIPDFRTTLYWNPNLEFNTNEKHIQCKASYSKGTYSITIVGFDAEGEKFYGKKQITIH